MTYLEMVNEVLVRMREDTITSVDPTKPPPDPNLNQRMTWQAGPDNEPQQKLVCKFVNDARSFVDKSHTWNVQRKVWVIDLAKGIPAYTLFDSAESGSVYSCRWAGSAGNLREANARWLSQKKQTYGTPLYYSPGYVFNHEMQVRVWPTPDEENEKAGDVSEYNIAEYNEAEYSGGRISSNKTTLVLEGYKATPRLVKDNDPILLPIDPVMYFALAYASRERGEIGGQTSGELFALGKQYLSDAISWDVNNAPLEYLWSTR